MIDFINFNQNYRQRYTVIPITTVRGPSSISIPLTTSTATSSLIRFLCIYTHVLSYDTYTHVDIHFKYIWASGRDLILTSVAHLRKKAELKVVGVLEVRTWGWAGVSVLVNYT